MKHLLRRIVILALIPLFGTTLPALPNDTVLKAEQLSSVGALGWFAAGLEVKQADPAKEVVAPNKDDPGVVLLRRLIAQGRATGLPDVLYDNRDRGHSRLEKSQFPSLSHLAYGPKLKEQALDYGLAGRIILPNVVIGNSSTAIESRPIARSQSRLGMTSHLGPERAYLTYINNHIYVYPEHQDHDASDRFPANWPYMITSQGSSFSDQPFMQALVMTLAAFPRETHDFMVEKRLVAPTLQMILRRSLKGIYRREQYLSGAAHPTVFDGKQVAADRMISLANSIRPEDIPPMVRISVESEDFESAAGLAKLSERLFDTPSAIARIWRSSDYVREMTVSAAETRDPNGRDLTYRWVLLRGDPEKVRINKLDATGARALIRVDWHDRQFIGKGKGRATDRVDIGVFANNGAHDSAPAFVSISFPGHQLREYARVVEGEAPKLVSIDYAATERKEYFDPLIHWYANWRDEFTYAPDGKLESWKRTTTDQSQMWLKHKNPSKEVKVTYDTKDATKGPKLVMVE